VSPRSIIENCFADLRDQGAFNDVHRIGSIVMMDLEATAARVEANTRPRRCGAAEASKPKLVATKGIAVARLRAPQSADYCNKYCMHRLSKKLTGLQPRARRRRERKRAKKVQDGRGSARPLSSFPTRPSSFVRHG
jgi:hypothetical protein